MNVFPAILIGGPPHSGKSVLTYLLTRRLREQGIEHYVLRACPDGEGDWSQEAPPDMVRLLRQKGAFSGSFVDRMCRDLGRRHLPLIVDAGGRPTLDQERIFDYCTHAVLIAATPEGLEEWRARAERHGLSIIAELHSTLSGADRLDTEMPVLRGRIAGLERHTASAGTLVVKLSERLARLMSYSPNELKARHLQQAPTELALDVAQLARYAGSSAPHHSWQPVDLPLALAGVPQAPLSLYGRGPNWLYVAFALHVVPHPFYLFDPRSGWTLPVTVQCGPQPQSATLEWQTRVAREYTWLEVRPKQPYLDYEDLQWTESPVLDLQRGVVISGKLPHWLTTGIARAYHQHPWLAVAQAQLYDRAIVVMSRSADIPPGAWVRL